MWSLSLLLLFTSIIDSPGKEIDYVKVSKIIDLFGLLFDTVKAKKSEKTALTGKLFCVKHFFILNILHF